MYSATKALPIPNRVANSGSNPNQKVGIGLKTSSINSMQRSINEALDNETTAKANLVASQLSITGPESKPNAKVLTVKYMTDDQHTDLRNKSLAYLEARDNARETIRNVRVELKTEHEKLTSEIQVHKKEAEIHRQNAEILFQNAQASLIKKTEFLENSLEELPNNWNKTGKDEKSLLLISKQIKFAIDLSRSFRRDFQSVNCDQGAMKIRSEQIDKEVKKADQLIALIKKLKDGK